MSKSTPNTKLPFQLYPFLVKHPLCEVFIGIVAAQSHFTAFQDACYNWGNAAEYEFLELEKFRELQGMYTVHIAQFDYGIKE